MISARRSTRLAEKQQERDEVEDDDKENKKEKENEKSLEVGEVPGIPSSLFDLAIRQLYKNAGAHVRKCGIGARQIVRNANKANKTCLHFKKIEIQFGLEDREFLTFLRKERHVKQRIASDVLLNGRYFRKFNPIMSRENALNALQRWRAKLNCKMRNVTDLSPMLAEFLANTKYNPSSVRRQGASLIVNANGIITNTPVICDIGSTSLEGPMLDFINIEQNIIQDKNLIKLTEEVEEDKNIIKCSCCSANGTANVVPCWKNPECECWQTNNKLQFLQAPSIGEKSSLFAEFNSFEPMSFGDLFNVVGFACSEKCACQGKCSNNVTLIAEKKLYPLEIFRKNSIIGFGLRTLAAIPAGTVFIEFTGEMMKASQVIGEDPAYSFEVEKIKDILGILETLKDWDESFMRRLRKQWDEQWLIATKKMGNISRLIAHSCDHNVATVRVFQKGFSPQHCRIFFVTLSDVFPGAELFLNYGKEYVEGHFKGGCCCGSLVCHHSNQQEYVARATDSALLSMITLRQLKEFNRCKEILEETTD